ncbi:MAG: plasmid replication initiation protein [Gammaproteobacteria bacterium]|jgi:plasmid replication initiation protein
MNLSVTTPDFFVCDIWGALPKDDLASMEHPLFSLSTRPDRSILSYEHKGSLIEVVPSVKGRATIHDKDVLIYCISQIMAALNTNRAVSRTLHLTAHDLLLATGRETSGDAYRRLRDAFERLAGTRITTNITVGGEETTRGFGLIESWEIVRQTPNGKRGGGRMIRVCVTLSEWLYRAALSKSVLTLNRTYFDLRRPLERRLYELARKHCGRQSEWRISLEVLLKKSGSGSPRRVFRAMVRDIIASGHIPDYDLRLDAEDMLFVTPKVVVLERFETPHLTPETLAAARAAAPGDDVYALQADWHQFWHRTGRKPLRAPDKAFLGWLAKRQKARATE